MRVFASTTRAMPITFTSFGRAFADHDAAQEGDIVIDFGLDEIFLAELAPWTASTRQHLQANILQLLAFCHKLQAALAPLRRQLWCIGGRAGPGEQLGPAAG